MRKLWSNYGGESFGVRRRRAGSVLDPETNLMGDDKVVVALPFGHLRVSRLIKACAEGNVAIVASSLAALPNIQQVLEEDTDDWAGSTALHWAAYSGSAPIVTSLLAAKANPEQPNSRDRALPLHLAARYNGNTEALSVLCAAAPHTVNVTNARGNTPLHETAYEGRVEAAALLLASGAQLEAVNASVEPGGLTPLLAAVQYGHVPLVRMLLHSRADASTSPRTARQLVRSPHCSESRLSESGRPLRLEPLVGDGKSPARIGGGKSPVRIGGGRLGSPRGAAAAGAVLSSRRPLTAGERSQAAGEDEDEPLWIVGHGALSLALAFGQLRVASELIDQLHAQHGFFPPILSFNLLVHLVTRLFISAPSGMELSVEETLHLFTTCVLCARPAGAPPLIDAARFGREQPMPLAPTTNTGPEPTSVPASGAAPDASPTPLPFNAEEAAAAASTFKDALTQAHHGRQHRPSNDRSQFGDGRRARLSGEKFRASFSVTFAELAEVIDDRGSLSLLSGNAGETSNLMAAKAEVNNLLLREVRCPPNPVLCALQLASACRDEMRHFQRDRAVSDKLLHASRVLEYVASGLMHGAERAANERFEVTKSFNPWITGTRPVEPSVARDFFTATALHHAGQCGVALFQWRGRCSIPHSSMVSVSSFHSNSDC